LLTALILSIPSFAAGGVDSDNDGLPDLVEQYATFTDPQKADTDEDGLLDGEWDERREFTYTVRVELELLSPIDVAQMNTRQQHARLLDTRAHTVVVEVITYPLNTWHLHDAALPLSEAPDHFHSPSTTMNYDAAMQAEILRATGLDLATISDREAVQRVSSWVMNPVEFPNKAPFFAYAVDFENGSPTVRDGFMPLFLNDNDPVPAAELPDYVASGSLGRTMFTERARGSCTPSHILIGTTLRAVGVPTRMVLAVPALDPNDRRQRKLVAGLDHEWMRATLEQGLLGLRGWIGHTMNEVQVGGQWMWLNYDNVGQRNADPGMMGLMIQVATMDDWADNQFAQTWGQRVIDAESGRLEPALTSVNQYRAVHLSDEMGPHTDPERLWVPPAPPTPSKLARGKAHVNTVFWAHDRTEDWWPAEAIRAQVPEHTIVLAVSDSRLRCQL